MQRIFKKNSFFGFCGVIDGGGGDYVRLRKNE